MNFVWMVVQGSAILWMTWAMHEGDHDIPAGGAFLMSIIIVAFATGLIVNLWDGLGAVVRYLSQRPRAKQPGKRVLARTGAHPP